MEKYIFGNGFSSYSPELRALLEKEGCINLMSLQYKMLSEGRIKKSSEPAKTNNRCSFSEWVSATEPL